LSINTHQQQNDTDTDDAESDCTACFPSDELLGTTLTTLSTDKPHQPLHHSNQTFAINGQLCTDVLVNKTLAIKYTADFLSFLTDAVT